MQRVLKLVFSVLCQSRSRLPESKLTVVGSQLVRPQLTGDSTVEGWDERTSDLYLQRGKLVSTPIYT